MPPVAIEPEEPKLSDGGGGGPRDFDPNDRFGGGGDDRDGGRGKFVPGAGLLAMRLVLVSITTLFVTIGVVYFERSRSPVNWQHIRVPPLLWLSTALILSSGWTLEIARLALERRQVGRYLRWVQITVCFGLAFLFSQLLALQELVEQGIYLRGNPHSSLFYVVTGAHGIHLLGGIAALCFLLIRRADFGRQRSRTAVSALYWHFLTVLWVGLFLCLLMWP